MPTEIPSIIFITGLAGLVVILWHSQRKPDDFDLRDVICSWDNKNKKQTVSTSKTLLTGAFLTASYVLIEHYTETAFGLYLTAWVVNGGVVAFAKTRKPPEN